MRGRRLIAAGVLTAASFSSTVAGLAVTGTLDKAFGSPPQCGPVSPPVSQPVSGPVGRLNGDDRNGNKDRNNDRDDRCGQVSPPVSRPVGQPTNKDQCKKGGWESFGTMFKNQGDCVSFVASDGKNAPNGS